ncbi:MAG: sugar ABC transporter ATP-binding protein [Phycisphaerales bacterium JB061]
MSDECHNAFLRVEGVSKRFGITQALSDVSVSFCAGEVHALMGENGAGKSTLGKAIAGLHKPDTGRIILDGKELKLGSIDDAFEAGVRIVHQELAQCPNLSVAENLCLHDMPCRKLGTVDFDEMVRRAEALVHRLDPSIDVRRPLGGLSPGKRQICQIAAALEDGAERGGSSPRVIVFDEPTSSLSIAEADRLGEIVRELAAQGLTIIYVSHRMGEIFSCCDRVSVLRDGKFVATNEVKGLDEATLVEQMIGRRVVTPTGKVQAEGGEAQALQAVSGLEGDHPQAGRVVLRASSISSPGKVKGVSLEVRAGEVLGIGGLVGAGRSELLAAIFGLDPNATGQIELEGKTLALGDVRSSIREGMGLVPEDRRHEGLFFQLGVDENIVAPRMPLLANRRFPFGLRRQCDENDVVAEKIKTFRVKTATTKSSPGELSGGNQQKLLIARWMGRETKVLLLDEPTRGIDVGTKVEVYKLIREAVDKGLAVVLVSSEMPELLALSDRIMVLADGVCTGTLEGDDMTQTNVLTLATQEVVVA